MFHVEYKTDMNMADGFNEVGPILGEMERQLSLTSSNRQLFSHDVNIGVIGQFQVINTRHYRWQEAIRRLFVITDFSHNRQWRIQTFETCK